MRSTWTWLVALSAAVSLGIACSDDPTDPVTGDLPNQPAGNAGTGGMGGGMPVMNPPLPAGTGGSGGGEAQPTPALAMGGGAGQSANAGQNQGGGAGVADAGAPAPGPDAGGPVGTPDAAPAPDDGEPPADDVTFADVFPLLVTSCGGCHGVNATNGKPEFAQTGNPGASFTATQGTSMNQLVSARILARAVTQRDMPPQCNARGTCLNAQDAALVQAWVTQGALP